jgi:hypothetical protein
MPGNAKGAVGALSIDETAVRNILLKFDAYNTYLNEKIPPLIDNMDAALKDCKGEYAAELANIHHRLSTTIYLMPGGLTDIMHEASDRLQLAASSFYDLDRLLAGKYAE